MRIAEYDDRLSGLAMVAIGGVLVSLSLALGG